jgi:hypothetical protein
MLVPEFIGGRTIWKLKIGKQATKAVEALLSARDLAYRIIYYHPTHRIAQEMMIAALYELTEAEKELTAEEIALFTDEELLLAFSKGNAFTKDVARRIYYRGLYEPLPFRLNVRRDLDEATQERVLELAHPKTKGEYAQRSSYASKAGEDLQLPPHQRVIFDLEPVPVTAIDAYKERVLYDETAGTSSDLFSEVRHLRHSHGELEFGDEKLDMHIRYIKECTELQMALPFEFIDNCVQELQNVINQEINQPPAKQESASKRKRAKKRQLTSRGTQQLLFGAVETAKAAAQEIANRKLRPLFDGLMAVLDITSVDQREKLLQRFNASMAYYLLHSVRPRLVVDMPTLATLLDEELTRLGRPGESH